MTQPHLSSPAAAMEEQQQHIVMVPFMAQGHFIPFLSLAHLIHQRHPSCAITIATTPLNIHSLRSTLPPNSPIRLADLPFSPVHHGLPPGAENSDSLPRIDILPRLFLASESLSPHLDGLLSRLSPPPLLLIADVFAAWSLPVARRHRIPHFSFTTSGAFGTAVFMSLWLHLPHRLTDADPFPVPGFPDGFRLCRSQMSHYMRAADGSDDWSVFLRRQMRLYAHSDALLCNTVAEIEPRGLQLLRRVAGLRVFPVGPLVPLGAGPQPHPRSGRKVEIDSEACREWLDGCATASVLYVAFGSQNTIGAAQMTALAGGLEASGVAFIWVVRPPVGFDMSGEFRGEEWLPAGFEERMGGRGIVVRRWAPQLEILSHRATGGFLSHCGWNSVQESLSRGVPVIGWPVASEQFYNSKMMDEEMGVAVEVARGVEGEVDAGKVERVVRMVMEGDKGREMRGRAARCAEMIRDAMKDEGEKKGSSFRAIDEILEAAMAGSYKKFGGSA